MKNDDDLHRSGLPSGWLDEKMRVTISDAVDASRGDDEWLSHVAKIGQIEGSTDIDVFQVMRRGTFCEASALFPYVKKSGRRFLLFSIWCAEQVAHYGTVPSRRALEIAKEYAAGAATEKQFASTGRRLSSILERMDEEYTYSCGEEKDNEEKDNRYISICAVSAVNAIYCFRVKGFSAMNAWEDMMMALHPGTRPDIDGISDDELPWDKASAEEFVKICQSEPEDAEEVTT